MKKMKVTGAEALKMRNKLGLSQRAVAEGAGLNRARLSSFERGELVPRDDFLVSLRNYLESKGCTFKEPIVDEDGYIPPEDAGFYLRDGFAVALSVSDDEAELILGELHHLEDRIESLKALPTEYVKPSWSLFEDEEEAENKGVMPECEERQKELQVLMARSYNLVRKLHGWSVVEPAGNCGGLESKDLPKVDDHQGLLSQAFDWITGISEEGKQGKDAD